LRPSKSSPFDGREAFHAAVIEALDASRRAITMVDHDFSSWPLESAAGERALRDALRRGATLRLLVSERGWLERHGSRFLRLRREQAHRVECRQIPPNLRVDESALVADGQHLVRRARWDRFAGHLAIATPSEVEPLVERYDSVWDESEPCLAATTLGL